MLHVLPNNGQAFGGLSANTAFYNVTTALAMAAGRFGLAIPALAFAGLFARQRKTQVGTLPTDSLPFGIFQIVCLIVITALSYLPVLAIGPVFEHLAFGT
jgi:K+-transporting ATPase ATPase A chain